MVQNPSKNHLSESRKVPENDAKMTGKGRKWSLKGSKKSSKIIPKTVPEKGRNLLKNLEKNNQEREGPRRTNWGRNIIRAT